MTSTTCCRPSAAACPSTASSTPRRSTARARYVMYRKDLMEKAGLKMPDAPTWDFIKQAADKMTDSANGHQRHLPARQGRLGREHGLPDRHVELVRRALVRREVEAAVRSAGMEEHAALLRRPDEGRRSCRRLLERLQREPRPVPAGQVRHVDRRHGRRLASSPIRRHSTVADKVGFALAPDNGLGKRGNWLWAWSLAIPAGSQKIDAAEKFISWATSKHYTELVAAQGRLGQRSSGHAHLALQEPGLSEGGAVRRR